MQASDAGISSLRIEGTPDLEILRAETEGAPILFLHGYTSGAWQFAKHFMPALAEDSFDCWALNLRDHGGSGGRDQVRKARFVDYARDVSFVEEKTNKTPILIGHSLGSVLARDYAVKHEVPALALVSFGDIGLGMKDFMGWIMRRFPIKGMIGMMTGRPSAMFREFEPQYSIMYDGYPRDSVRENVSRLMAQPDSDKVFMELGKLTFTAPKVASPIFLMAGDRDAIASRRAVIALGKTLNCAPVILEGEAHDLFAGPNWERGFTHLRDWLSTVTRP